MDVGQRIVQLRKKRNITTNKLANMAGISQSYLRDIENGKINPTVEKLEYICEALNISLLEFFENETSSHDLSLAISKLTEKEKDALLNFLNTIKY